MDTRRWLGPLVLIGLQSCVIEADPRHHSGPGNITTAGTLVVDWTVDGRADPDACDQSAAATLDTSVWTSQGDPVGEFSDPCDVFVTSIDLEPGSYYAEAVLRDAYGADRTTAVPMDDITIFGGDTLTVPVDFPSSSFY